MWNYRLVRRRMKGETFYDIHEAYYDDAGKVWSITKEPTTAHGDTRDEVLECLARMMKDILRAPVLDYNKVPEKGAKSPGDDEKKKKRVRV
jgi:hypothetical protein